MPKPIVHYKLPIPEYLEVGSRVVVEPMDHPGPYVSNTRPVITSRVVAVKGAGVFATENTIYQPYYEELHV
jgi:hypothetical protein